jgi:hypothetical protein
MILRASYLQGYKITFKSCRNHADLSFKRQKGWHLTHETRSKPSKAPSPIPTHLRLSTVAIVVAHPKIRPATCSLDREQTVGPHPSVTIAKPSNGTAIK